MRPEQARSVRKLLAGLPLSQAHADGALSGFLDRFDALLPPARLNLILGGEDLSPTRRGLIEGCQDVVTCPWRDASAADTPQSCGPCRQRGVHRLVCALPEDQKGVLLLDSPKRAGASWRQLLEEVAQAVGMAVRLRSYNQ
ncbi:hypothetical protein [Pseudomonas sp. H3_A05]